MRCSSCGLAARYAVEEAVPSKGTSVRIVVAVVVLALAATGLALYMRESRKPKPVVLSGSLEARTVQVGSLVGGRVVRVLTDEGAHVAAGQLLVVLETDTIDRQIAEQRAAIDAANAQLAKLIAGPRSASPAGRSPHRSRHAARRSGDRSYRSPARRGAGRRRRARPHRSERGRRGRRRATRPARFALPATR